MTVYMKPSWRVNSTSDWVYHTKKCQYYHKAKDGVFQEVPKREVPDGVRRCKACAGTADQERGERNSLAEMIEQEDFKPEDVGLTPLGER